MQRTKTTMLVTATFLLMGVAGQGSAALVTVGINFDNPSNNSDPAFNPAGTGWNNLTASSASGPETLTRTNLTGLNGESTSIGVSVTFQLSTNQNSGVPEPLFPSFTHDFFTIVGQFGQSIVISGLDPQTDYQIEVLGFSLAQPAAPGTAVIGSETVFISGSSQSVSPTQTDLANASLPPFRPASDGTFTFQPSSPGVTLISAIRITFDDGDVTPVIPEPASVALLAIGGALLLPRRRRQA